LVGLYCIETWFVLLGLVVSDTFQAAFQRKKRPKRIKGEQTLATKLEIEGRENLEAQCERWPGEDQARSGRPSG
jgi:hypothetical protein